MLRFGLDGKRLCDKPRARKMLGYNPPVPKIPWIFDAGAGSSVCVGPDFADRDERCGGGVLWGRIRKRGSS